MKKLILIILLAFAVGAGTAQKAVVKSFEAAPMDVTAQKYARQDLHGEKCALVKVMVVASNVSFQGNLIGDRKTSTRLISSDHSFSTIFI